MNIISYNISGNMLEIRTDYRTVPFFVYPILKFKTLAALTKEINKKIACIEKAKAKLAQSTLITELDEALK